MTVRRLIIGGARSGKSRFAESLLADAAAVEYVATSEIRTDDPEWTARVAAHVARRPSHWRTTETTDLVAVLERRDPGVALVDCLTVWLTRQMDATGCWESEASAGPADPDRRPSAPTDALDRLNSHITALVTALTATSRDVVAVTNEVGQGVVPPTASGRLLRDQMGICNARVAAAVDEVWWVVAGIPTRIKG